MKNFCKRNLLLRSFASVGSCVYFYLLSKQASIAACESVFLPLTGRELVSCYVSRSAACQVANNELLQIREISRKITAFTASVYMFDVLINARSSKSKLATTCA